MEESQSVTLRARNSYLDFVKGVAILLVLWGHCIQYGMAGAGDFFENPLFKIIYSFHMPLFMIVSGYLFFYSLRNKTLIKTVWSRVCSLGMPILVWGCFPRLISAIISFSRGNEKVYMSNIIKIAYEVTIRGCTSFWFLWSVLLISIIVAFGEKVIRSYWRGLYLLSVIVVILILPGRENNLFMYPYFLFGFYSHDLLGKIKFKYRLMNFCKLFCMALFVILIFFYTEDCYIYTTGLWIEQVESVSCKQIGIDLYRYIIGFAGSIAVLIFLTKIYRWNRMQKVWQYVERLGKMSLQIYILQHYVVENLEANTIISIVKYLGMNPFARNLIVYDLILTPIAAIVNAVLIEKIILSLQRIKVSTILFGR